MNILVLAFLFYLLYRFIAGFLVPLFRASVRMRSQFNEMNGKTNGRTTTGDQERTGSNKMDKSETQKSGSKVGEYIDFEEVE